MDLLCDGLGDTSFLRGSEADPSLLYAHVARDRRCCSCRSWSRAGNGSVYCPGPPVGGSLTPLSRLASLNLIPILMIWSRNARDCELIGAAWLLQHEGCKAQPLYALG